MYSRGFEDSEYEEEANDTEESETEDDDSAEEAAREETPPQRGSARQMKREAVKKVLTVDEKGLPYGIFQKAYEEDLRLIAKDLDPNYNFKEQSQAMRVRFFNRLAAGKRIVLLLEGFRVFYLRGCLLGCLQWCPTGCVTRCL